LAKKQISKLEVYVTFTLAGLVLLAFVGVGWFAWSNSDDFETIDNTSLSIRAQKKAELQAELAKIKPEQWELIYPDTKAMTIGEIPVKASIADSWPERILGLSDTPFLPEDVVKLFIFDTPGLHSIWMKDMNYPIDIIWVSGTGVIVDIKESALPESFPASFSSTVDAVYVIETVAGFAEKFRVAIGDTVVLPNL